MSTINKNNYEAFLLDYAEQNLSPDLVAELMLFLEQHPEVKAELDEFENVTFEANTSTTFNHKETLKQAAIEELMIAQIEGLNSPEESNELFTEIAKNSTYNQLFSNYKKTILIPAPIVFEDKKALKQKDTKVVPLYWWISSAAAILVLFLLLKNFNNDTVEPLIVESNQSSVLNQQSSIVSSQTTDTNQQFSNNNTKPKTKSNTQNSSLRTHHSEPTTQHPEPKEMITIEPVEKEYIVIEPSKTEYIEIEPYVAEVNHAKQDEYLSVSELLKKEAQKRILETETKNAPAELVAANLVAKVLGKNAEVETAQNDQGETEEYALNIGEFSFSRKIRK
ncbi:MAG: hypothetical protein HYU68_09320 [Bacteroidetes bacterium]|nr:hypothetical protein [Bacteroidota bacterium]